MIKGYSGKYGTFNHFIFEKVDAEDVKKARELVTLSSKIIEIQSAYLKKFKSSQQERLASTDIDVLECRISLRTNAYITLFLYLLFVLVFMDNRNDAVKHITGIESTNIVRICIGG